MSAKPLTNAINDWLLIYEKSNEYSKNTMIEITRLDVLKDVIDYLIDQDMNLLHNK